MSSLICMAGKCTFTRVDTNATAIVPPDYYENLPDLGLRRKLEDSLSVPINDDFIINLPEVDRSNAPWFLPENQDKLSPSVAITRDYIGSLFNAFSLYDPYSGPYGTEWVLLPDGASFEEVRCRLQFCNWQGSSCVRHYDPEEMIGKPAVVHLLKEDLYYNFVLTEWSSDGSFGPFAGGFQYIRDEVPINGADFGECPICNMAKASPSQLVGPIDNQFVEVSIQGVSEDATVFIKGVTQESTLACNLRPTNTTAIVVPEGYDHVLPNAIMSGETVSLRRFRVVGQLSRFFYKVYFSASNDAGTCNGSVRVCVPPPGFSCNDIETVYESDASAVAYCLGGYI